MFGRPRETMIASEIDRRFPGPRYCREHKYRGGFPPKRLAKMQFAHEMRARKAGVEWDYVDMRDVYKSAVGICGICGEPVPFESFSVDHRIPMSRGGPHLPCNLQPSHLACNLKKGQS